MQVFKFGGASIKDVKAVKNIAAILANYQEEKLVVVVSAMGKTTNKLESILHAYLNGDDYKQQLNTLSAAHQEIINGLFEQPAAVMNELDTLIQQLRNTLNDNKNEPYNFLYDAIISMGERMSSLIIARYLKAEGFSISLVAAKDVIRTDSNYKEAQVDWKATEKQISTSVETIHLQNNIVLSQGFIGGDKHGNYTTLGREGSDFTAAIFASCLNAESVTIWKDVPGILNADPKKIENAQLYRELSYQEAAEMTYYGASVIHPKTIKPLANQKIPLYVRSFQTPLETGTVIHDCLVEHLTPCIIMKEQQCLITFKVTDFTFINEHNLSKIFQALSQHRIKINMMQNSAISFSLCVNEEAYKLDPFMAHLKDEFDILYNNKLTLVTIKNYEEGIIDQLKLNKQVYIEQRTRKNFQMVIYDEALG
jgi:aspartate kinase